MRTGEQELRNSATSKTVTVLSVLLCVYGLSYIAGAFDVLRIYYPDRVHRAIVLGFMLALTFLAFPTRKGKRNLPWLNIFLSLLSISGIIYFISYFEQVEEHFFRLSDPSAFEIALGLITLVLTIEAVRRVVGWPMALIVLIFFIYPFVAQYLPGFFHGRAYSLARITAMLFVSTDGMLGIALGVAATIVIMFVMFGELLINTGGGKFFIDLALGLFGSVRGGPAKVAVAASCLFGTISGSSTANVATTGSITIPMMKQVGYDPAFAGAVESVASNGGPLMPPIMGAVAFIISEFLAMPYIMVCLYSLVPAILYYVTVFIAVDLEAARTGLKGLPRREMPSLKLTMKRGWFYFLPLILLVFLLAALGWSPQKSAFWALTAFWVISLMKKESRLGLEGIVRVFVGTARSTCLVGLACAGAGIIIGVISMTALGFRFSGALIDISGGNLLVLLILTSVACFILGMSIGAITIYITLAVLVAPTLIQAGVVPIAAHLFVFWWGLTAYITPPVAINAFVASGISGASPIKTAIQATRLGICTFILPFIFVYNPALILIGSPMDILGVLFTTTFAVAALAVALTGYFLTPIRWQRILLLLASVCLMIPNLIAATVGFVISVIFVIWQVKAYAVRKRVAILASD